MQVQTFRRSVLDVAHAQIETTAVEKKTSVAWRLFVIAVMQVDRANLSVAEKIVFDLRWPELGVNVGLLVTEKAPVLSLNPYDPIHSEQLTPRMAIWLELIAYLAILGRQSKKSKFFHGTCRFQRTMCELSPSQLRRPGSTPELTKDSCSGVLRRDLRRNENDAYVWNEFMRKRGWNDEMSKILERRKKETGITDRSDI